MFKKLVGLVLVLALAGSASATGLTSWYNFESGMTDTQGTNNGTALGGATTAFDVGDAAKAPSNVLTLDGDGDYVNIGNDASLDRADSIAAWVKFDTKNAGWLAVAAKGSTSWRQLIYGSWHEQEGPAYGNGVTMSFWPMGEFDDGSWHHMVGTYSKAADPSPYAFQVDVYLDGVNVWTGPAGPDAGFNAGDAGIGWDPQEALAADFFTGEMDDVAIWSGHSVTAAGALGLYEGTYTPETAPTVVVPEPATMLLLGLGGLGLVRRKR